MDEQNLFIMMGIEVLLLGSLLNGKGIKEPSGDTGNIL